MPLRDWQADGKRAFAFSDNEATITGEGAEDAAYAVQFKVTQNGQDAVGTLPFADDSMVGAIVIDKDDIPQTAQVCDGHVFVVNLASERGGTLVLGNLRAGRLAMTSLPYSSGEEDTAEVSFKEGALVVSDSDGRIRLQETRAADAETPAYGLVPESLQCVHDDAEGHTWLKLLPYADGGIHAFEYLSIMPGGASCSVLASGAEGAELIQRQGGTDIVWNDGRDESRGSHMRIERSGDAYRLDTAGHFPPAFCGQGARLAASVTLKRGQAECATVQWPTD